MSPGPFRDDDGNAEQPAFNARTVRDYPKRDNEIQVKIIPPA